MGQSASRGLRNADWLSLLDDDVLQVHDLAPFKCSEVRSDSTQTVLVLCDGLLDLGMTQPQHSAKLLDRDFLVQDFRICSRPNPMSRNATIRCSRSNC